MSKEFIDKYLKETEEIINDVNRMEISRFINILFDAWKNGKKVITMGNGGSASTASHFAGDLLKTSVQDSSFTEIRDVKGFKAICLNDNQPALTAWINDSGWEKAYSGLLNTLLDEGDVILLVSVHGGSGWSGNLVHAMDLAKKRGAKIIGLAGFDGGKMKELCDSCIVVPKDSTPHTEGFHGILQHLIIFRIQEMISEHIEQTQNGKIKLFADTANYKELGYSLLRGVDDGITTNPKIMENDDVSNFVNACESLLIKYPKIPISLETDLRGIEVSDLDNKAEEVRDTLLKQAHELARLGENIVIKIPICEGGLMAVRKLLSEGLETNVTACMNPFQALAAVDAGATYVSLFANRMLDSHIIDLAGHPLSEITSNPNWKNILKENTPEFKEEAWERTQKQIAYVAKKCEEKGCKLIVGSIRGPTDVHRISKCKPQVITLPTKIIEELDEISNIKDQKREIELDEIEEHLYGNSLSHPMTHYTLEEFERAADHYRIKQLN